MQATHSDLKTQLVLLLDKLIPFLVAAKRFACACWDSWTPSRRSYSQHGEDILVLSELHGWNPRDAIYVDVGANHPTCISNTYFLYRRGWHGIVVEPNAGLIQLHRVFRPRDVQICVGCGRQAALMPFYVSRAPSLSSFSSPEAKYVSRIDYLPVLTLDQLLEPFADKRIALLSIDTEGVDYDVLIGAEKTLNRTHLLCVESNHAGEREKIRSLLEPRFDIVAQVGCNHIFKRREAQPAKG